MNKKEKHTPEELADAMIFPVTLTAQQKKEAAVQLAAARKKTQRNTSDADNLALALLQLKFQLEDYIADKQYNHENHFGSFLKKYIDILQLKRKDFALAISIDETMLSQLINMHRAPPDYVIIRLELHSNNIIPAEHWFKLVEKTRMFQISTDKTLRTKEKKFVRRLSVSL